jgi:hypothetical protein
MKNNACKDACGSERNGMLLANIKSFFGRKPPNSGRPAPPER